MTATVANRHTLTRNSLRRCAMACALLALGAGPALAQTTPAQPAVAAAKPSVPVLGRAQVDALLAAPARLLVLDVRRADEISAIGGFPVYLNVQAGDIERSLAYIPRDRKILTVSNHAHRADAAAAVLKKHGFQVVGAAGAQDYQAEGGKLTGQKPPEKAAQTPSATQPSGSN